ncbi:alpha-ketoglutaric semialdehyde dehydrogenase GucD [Shimazuella alba]|uniref:Aldehyde dehydrogenase family protein n=1 Tax=Shimazuella alba TaxID=2690964 RepID=A0A6I4VZQ4_9BACL|nr:alpha-ketoglutaric semialdehyde dehydrogenase GucD [Shimazuella alba]MXQ55216.1 aldehyde dehydrogenase family protein [Shimazuella alba]
MTTYQNYINGTWVDSHSGQTISITNPANWNEPVGFVQKSDQNDVSSAVQAAKQANSTWGQLSPIARGAYLEKTARILEERIVDIATTATQEMGKTLVETTGEMGRAIAILKYYAQEGWRKTGDVIPSSEEKNLLYTTRVPLGVVSVITPWNFPIAIPIWKIAPALVFGNTVVFKPAEETSITGIKLVQAFHDAGLPAGVINIVTGKGAEIGPEMVQNPSVNGITFTGSNGVGKGIAMEALSRGCKYQLEMGGKNPAIVLADADLDHAATLVVSGAMKHTGQKCTATSRVIIEASVYKQVKEKILEKVKQIQVGNGLDEDTYMGPVVSSKQQKNVLNMIEKGISEGATLLYGGKILTGDQFDQGYFIEPTLFEDVTNDMSIAQEEIFGPVLCLIKVDSLEDAIQVANDSSYGLSASLFTRDLAKTLQFTQQMEAGLIKVNGESAGVELQAPFGGMKSSSSHSREQGQAAVEFFTSIKTITITPIT